MKSKKAIILAIVGLTGLMLGGCPFLPGPDDTLTLDASDNGQTVSLAVGAQLKVVLDSNPTTGYAWVYREVDDGILQNDGSEYTPGMSAILGAIGAGGTETWTFTALQAGTTTLRLEYIRSFDPEGTAPAEVFEVTVVVGEENEVVTIDASNNGEDVSVPLTSILKVELASNPTTGFAWEVDELDAAILENTGSDYETSCPPDGEPVGGCGGTDTWEFTPVTAGTTTLRMIYRQPWVPVEETEPAETFEVTITVE